MQNSFLQYKDSLGKPALCKAVVKLVEIIESGVMKKIPVTVLSARLAKLITDDREMIDDKRTPLSLQYFLL